jgi:ATP-binding cassette subfamily F protein 3
MVTSIAELYGGGITEYAGNYAFYLEERKERRALQQSAYDNQQREIAQTERFIERFRYKASKATQVQSRVKALERMERIAPPPSEEAAIHFRFPDPPRSGRTVLALSPFSKTYPNPEGGTIEVFDDAGPLQIERGQKIALIGKNGAGKSTLARILDGKEDFDGTRELGYEVRPAFFAQHQADTIPHSLTALDALREVAHGQSETALRSLLGAFLFQGDDVFKTVGVLSGGERSRLALARTLLSPANFLILDEPTNHLDMASKAVLVEALQQYSGTFVVVSHDRHFLDQITQTVWWVGGGDVRIYQGSYSDYLWQREQQAEAAGAPGGDGQRTPSAASSPKPEPKKSSGGKKTKEQKRREAEERNRLYRALQKGKPAGKIEDPKLLGRLVEKLENEVARKEEERAALEAKLADPNFYQQGEAFQQTMRAFADVEAELKDLMKRWEDAAAKLEAAEA